MDGGGDGGSKGEIKVSLKKMIKFEENDYD